MLEHRHFSWMRRTVIGGAISAFGVLVAAQAAAQDVPTAPSSPPPTATSADHGRLRIGLNANGGVGAGGGAVGPLFGATVRIGWQLDHLMAVYAQPSVFWWFSSEVRSADGSSTRGAVGLQLTPLFALTPADLLEVAAGPSVDRLQTASSSTPVSERSSAGDRITYWSFYFGLHGRVALHVPAIAARPTPQTSRRRGFTVGADLHSTFAEGKALAFLTLGLGADWY